MELENLALEEIEPFCDSLTTEKKYVTKPLKTVMGAKFVTAVRIDGKLAGVGGLNRYYYFLPVSFYIVKAEFQKKGVGSQLVRNIANYARGKGYSFFLSTVNIENTPAVSMHLQQGYKILYEADGEYRMGRPLNRRGEIICKFLPLIFKILLPVRGTVRRLRGQDTSKAV